MDGRIDGIFPESLNELYLCPLPRMSFNLIYIRTMTQLCTQFCNLLCVTFIRLKPIKPYQTVCVVRTGLKMEDISD